MAIYNYLCKNHKEPVIIEHEAPMGTQLAGVIKCPDCNGEARRHYHGQTVYGSNGPTSGGRKLLKRSY